LKQFRNYEKLSVDLNRGINILYGANAQGKTNFLEAVYFCATGRSKRANTDRELILFDRGEAHIQLQLEKEGFTDRLDVHLKRDAKKGVAVNGIAVKKLGDLFGVLYAVIFSPEELQLIKAGPAERRRFMDMEICQLSAVYYYELQQYHKILKQRNQLLKEIQKKRVLKDTLPVWDEQLAAHGVRVIEKRRAFLQKIDVLSREIHAKITEGKEILEIIYKPSVSEEEFGNKLKRNADRDILLGTTTVGVHKDDIQFLINQNDVRVYGSQGQQRTASLSAKLAEIDLIKEDQSTTPVLLLDDVLSELDQSRQKYLMRYIEQVQTIITATGAEDILGKLDNIENITVFQVENGSISLTNR
jgi:DNA replication and repair protein RecF